MLMSASPVAVTRAAGHAYLTWALASGVFRVCFDTIWRLRRSPARPAWPPARIPIFRLWAEVPTRRSPVGVHHGSHDPPNADGPRPALRVGDEVQRFAP